MSSENPYPWPKRFFVFASGARPEILKSSPTEEIGYTTLGGTVIMVAGMAFVSMWFALVSALSVNPFVALVPATLWGLAIFNLDRWLITTARRTRTKWGQILAMLPRLLLAVLLGVVISEPLILRIFDSEISDEAELARQDVLDEERRRQQEGPEAARMDENDRSIALFRQEQDQLLGARAAVDPETAAIDGEIDSLRGEIARLTEEIGVAQSTWQDAVFEANEELKVGEDSGRGAGAGVNYELKKEKADSLEAVFDGTKTQNEAAIALHQTRISQLQTDLDDGRVRAVAESALLNDRTESRLDEIPGEIDVLVVANAEIQAGMDAVIADLEDETQDPGMVARIEALERIGERSPSVKRAHLLLAGLFIFLDVLPVLGKFLQFMLPAKPYEQMLNAVDARASNNATVYGAKAELDRTQQLNQLHHEAALRANVEDDNLRHYVEGAGRLQRRLGDDRLRRWEDDQLGPDADIFDLDGFTSHGAEGDSSSAA